MPTAAAVPVVLDCDTGIDDALAIVHLLTHPGADLVGVTTVTGNVGAAQAARNSLGLLALAGHDDVPVFVGAPASLDGSFVGGASRVHGEDGVGGAALPEPSRAPEDEHAVEFLLRAARERPGELVVVATGPLTNVALAVALDPSFATNVRQVVVMGGAVLAPGNATPAAEANIWHDPEAADRVFAAGLPITLVPLDATMRQTFSLADQEALRGGGRVAAFLADALDQYFEFYRAVFGDAGLVALHDPLAAAIALDDATVVSEAVTTVRVETGVGPARGSTIADMRTFRRGDVRVPGATTRVVLDTRNDLARRLVEAAHLLP